MSKQPLSWDDVPYGYRAFWNPIERARLLHQTEINEERAEAEFIGRVHLCQELLGLPQTPPAELRTIHPDRRPAVLDPLIDQIKRWQR